MSIQSRAATAVVLAEQRRIDAERLARQAEIEQRCAAAHDYMWAIIDDADASIDIVSADGNEITLDVLGSAPDDAKFRVQVRVPVPVTDLRACTANLLVWSAHTGRWYDSVDHHPIRFHDLETLGVAFGRIANEPIVQLHEELPP